MAESSIDHASRFKKKNNYEKERHREQNSSSRHDNYYNEADNRGSSSIGGLNVFSRDHKPNPHDRSQRTMHDRRHPRSPKHDRVNHKSEEMRHRTSPHSSRYDEHRDSSRNMSSRVDRFTDRSFGSENRENVSSSDRMAKHHERNLYTNDNEYISSLNDKISHLSSQVLLLTQENEKLRYSLNGSNYHLQDPDADVNITFKDKYLERKFLPALEELVFQLMIGNVSIEEVEQLYSKGDLPEDGKNSPCLPEGDLFAVDNSTAKPSDEFPNVPRYDTSFSEVLQNEEEATTENEVKPSKFRSTCFNCGGSHLIRDCPQRIDYQKVAFAKKSFKTQAPKGRYHCLKNVESVFKPGVISTELREAMDLGSDQVPSYIYHMRLLDYPPGWLQEATVENSGISLYGIDEKSQKADSEEMDRKDGAQVLYDPSKFIDYPGFNIPLPPNIKDECDELGMPPMQPHHLRSFVEQNITTKVFCPKRKRKLTELDNKPAKIQRVEEDMEIASDDSDAGSVEFIPPLPTEDPPPPPPEILIVSDAEDSDSGTDTPLSDTLRETLAQRLKKGDDDQDLCTAPSLRDLEEIKKQLVQELGMASGSSSPLVLQEDSTDGTSEAIHNDASHQSDSSSESKTLRRSESIGSKSRLVMLGTPSLSRHSSYQKLPEYEKFSKDVTSHLNFENLPNSTGAYQKMKKILKKVKSKISSMV